MSKIIYKIAAIIFIATLLSSCSTPKNNLTYFQDLTSNDGVIQTTEHTNTIEPENNLIIIVNSEVPEATVDFNLPYINPVVPGTKEVNAVSQLQQYHVDTEGNIDFPKLGSIHVAGMTTYELKDFLVKEISKYVRDPQITVTLNGYRIVVMGEVNSPQTIFTNQDRFSILDALATAGDLTVYAERNNILVLRRGDNNQIEYHRVDLLSSDVVESPYFWLKNNDVVMVSPNQIKQDNSKLNQFNSYRLSVLSTVVSAASVIASLVIALTIK